MRSARLIILSRHRSVTFSALPSQPTPSPTPSPPFPRYIFHHSTISSPSPTPDTHQI